MTEARTVLGKLARAHLVEAAPGATGRWRMHDLVRLYATRVGEQHAQDDDRQVARELLLSHYLGIARAADSHLRALPGTALPDDALPAAKMHWPGWTPSGLA